MSESLPPEDVKRLAFRAFTDQLFAGHSPRKPRQLMSIPSVLENA